MFAPAAATFAVDAALMTPHLFPAYTYIPRAALALLAGTTVRLMINKSGANKSDQRAGNTSAERTPPLVLATQTAAIAALSLVYAVAAVDGTRPVFAATRPTPKLDDLIQPGSCAVGDNAPPTILNNRLVARHRNRDVEIDAFG